MWTRLQQAAIEGTVLGVKLGAALFIVAAVLILLAGDYAAVRQQAKQGAAAFQRFQQIDLVRAKTAQEK